jgi:threonyl-tRNA synthetase
VTEYRTRLAAAMERDHRGIGERQGLFIFHQWAPGAPFFLPHGMRIIRCAIARCSG